MVFGKKKEEAPSQPAKTPRVEPYDIHVMPAKFHQYLAVKRKSKLGIIILILLVIIIVLAGIAFGAYYFFTQLSKQPLSPGTNLNQPVIVPNTNENLNAVNENMPVSNMNEEPNANENINANINENLNANDNLNANLNANINENLNANANINLNGNLNANTNANENLNTNINANVPGAINYQGSMDSDKDNLTDIEEDLYTTEKRKPDTDEDGYLDGAEIARGYNPLAAGGTTLETSGLVNKYSHPLFNYEILYPTTWLAKPADQSLIEIIFQSSTQEYIQVSIEDNSNEMDLAQWYLMQSPSTDLNQLAKITTAKGYEALNSPDKLTYYLQDKEDLTKVYVISYNIGTLTQVNFLTTFDLMLNSFKLTKTAE